MIRIVACTLLFVTIVSCVLTPDYNNLRRDGSQVLPRQATDPCCKSCGGIQKALDECPAGSDIFCGCDQWVAAAPTCEACIFDVNFNTTYAANPGPALELFWAWCQCKWECRPVAEAIFGGPCDQTCRSKVLAKQGPDCSRCMKRVDPWFTSFFDVWIQQAKQFLKTGVSPYPGQLFFLYKSLIPCRKMLKDPVEIKTLLPNHSLS